MNYFDPATHTYTMDGRPVPSVTQVLAETGFIDKTWFTPGCAERGTAVHEMLALDDSGNLDITSIGPDLEGYLYAWRNYCSDYEEQERARFGAAQLFSAIEESLYSALGYAGTPDRVKGSLVIDIKSGEIPWWCGIQIAGYVAMLDNHTFGWQGLAVGVRADGSYTTRAYNALQISKAKRVFGSALSVCQCIRAKGGF